MGENSGGFGLRPWVLGFFSPWIFRETRQTTSLIYSILSNQRMINCVKTWVSLSWLRLLWRPGRLFECVWAAAPGSHDQRPGQDLHLRTGLQSRAVPDPTPPLRVSGLPTNSLLLLLLLFYIQGSVRTVCFWRHKIKVIIKLFQLWDIHSYRDKLDIVLESL